MSAKGKFYSKQAFLVGMVKCLESSRLLYIVDIKCYYQNQRKMVVLWYQLAFDKELSGI